MKTPINSKQIHDTLNYFYNIEPKKNYLPKSGLINHCHIIETDSKKKFVLKTYSNKNNRTKKDIIFEVKIINLARKNNFPTPVILKNKNGEYITSQNFNEKIYHSILMDFKEGKILKRKDTYLLGQVGKLQAELHMFFYRKIKQREKVRKILKNWDNWAKKDLRKIRPILKKYKIENSYVEKFLKTKKELDSLLPFLRRVPYAECHNDFFGGNILIKDRKINGILDFDNLYPGPLIFDLANTLRNWLYLSTPQKYDTIISKYLEGYQSSRKLSKKEVILLPRLILSRCFAITNSLFARDLIKGKKRLDRTVKFDSSWRKYLATNPKVFIP